jgi:Protein of unknown function (DUF4235)
MAEKSGTFTTRAIGGVAGAGAGFVTKKVMTVAWKRVTGREPPANPEDPEVALGEAVSWAAVMGVAMATARLLAIRLANKRLRNAVCETPDSGPPAD